MLNQIFELLYASLRALFRSDSLSKDNIAPKSRQNPDLRVSVEDPSDVRWDTTPSMSQKSSHSVSNGSIGGQNGHQHMMVEPNKPPLKPHMQNDCEKLVQQTQLITDLSDLDDTVTKSTMVPGSGGTMDDQSLPVRPEVMVQSTVVPLEDDQESAVKQDVLGSQFGMKQEQEDAARRYQIIDEHASYPDLHASIPSHRHLGEPPMMVSQRIYVDGSSANGTLAVPTSLYPRTPTPPRAFTMGQEPHSNHDCSFTDEDMVRLSQALVSHPQYPYYTCGWMAPSFLNICAPVTASEVQKRQDSNAAG
ncbi:hypothetical protein HD554DRAFT_2166754 [Boletus coccyginus]|nr:hypothetical protein HD554DRAFT_2166754 [Boletus coccyginus]